MLSLREVIQRELDVLMNLLGYFLRVTPDQARSLFVLVRPSRWCQSYSKRL